MLQHPQERIVSSCMHGIVFKIYEEASSEILLDSFSQRNIEVGHILWSYKQPLIYALFHLIRTSQGAEEDWGRESGSVTEPLQAMMQIVYLFICLDF